MRFNFGQKIIPFAPDPNGEIGNLNDPEPFAPQMTDAEKLEAVKDLCAKAEADFHARDKKNPHATRHVEIWIAFLRDIIAFVPECYPNIKATMEAEIHDQSEILKTRKKQLAKENQRGK